MKSRIITLQERVHAAAKPDNWQLDKLNKVFRVRRGHKNTGMKEKNLLSLSYGRIIQKDIETVGGLLPENFEGYQIVESGNLILRLTDLQNDKRSLRQGLVTQRGIITSAYDAVEVQCDNDPRFWFYSLLALDLAKHYYSLGGGVRQSVKFADFPNDWIYRPDLAAQRQIADFLDRETARIELLIEKKQRLVALLGEQRSAAISSAVTVSLDDDANLVPTDSQYLPRVPASWRVWRLKHLAQIRGGLTLGRTISDSVETTQTPYMRVANVQAGWLNLNDVAEIPVTEVEKKRYQLKYGDVLMNEGGDNDKLGRGAVWKSEIEACVHQNHVFAVRLYDTRYSDWVSMATNARYARDFFYLHSNQSTNLASISKTNLARFPIALPPLDEMKAVMDTLWRRLGRLDRINRKTNASIDRLKEYRSALITAAVTGQIDVTTYAQSGTPDRRLDAIQEEMGA
ncbi:restriction endonuclease subunit S [Yoonia sp. MH D7]